MPVPTDALYDANRLPLDTGDLVLCDNGLVWVIEPADPGYVKYGIARAHKFKRQGPSAAETVKTYFAVKIDRDEIVNDRRAMMALFRNKYSTSVDAKERREDIRERRRAYSTRLQGKYEVG